MDTTEKLQNFENDKLIDIVRNYRQYGYGDDVRNAALTTLESRGISKADLIDTGSYDNKSYDNAQELYKAFRKNSGMGLTVYLLLLASSLIIPFLSANNSLDHLVGLWISIFIAKLVLYILFFVFLIRAYLNQDRFYKIVGDKYGVEGVLMYIFLGIPFYIIMYFVFSKQMKEKMKDIR